MYLKSQQDHVICYTNNNDGHRYDRRLEVAVDHLCAVEFSYNRW